MNSKQTYDINVEAALAKVKMELRLHDVRGFSAPEINRRVANARTDASYDLRDAIIVDIVRGDELEADSRVVL